MSQKRINLSELGKMLNASFSSSELSSMAFDIDPGFLHDEISHLAKSKKVIEIIKFCALRGDLEKILEFTKNNNPYRYNEFLPVLYEDGDPTELIKGLSPVSDEASNDVKEILGEMRGLLRDLKDKGMGDNITINYSEKGDIMTDNSKKQEIFIENSTINGNVGIMADTIQDSFNTVKNAESSEEIKTLLATLIQSVEKVSKEGLPENQDDAEEMVTNCQRFAEDVTNKKPKERYIRFSYEGLVSAAENIGKLAGPVVVAAKSVMRALGFTI